MSAQKIKDEIAESEQEDNEQEEATDEDEYEDEEEEGEPKECSPNASAAMAMCRLACLTGGFITVFTEEYFGIFIMLYMMQLMMRVVCKWMANSFDEHDRLYLVAE